MEGGIVGKIAWINLSDGTTRVDEPEKDLYKQFLGGYGIGVRLLYEKIKKWCPMSHF